MLRRGELLAELALERGGRPRLVRDAPRGRVVLGDARVELAVAGLALAARGPEALDALGVRRDVHVAVADAPGELDRLRAEAGHDDRRRLLRPREDPRALDGVVAAVVAWTISPVHSARMISTASSSISRRTGAAGQ